MKTCALLGLLALCLAVPVSAQVKVPDNFHTVRGLMDECSTKAGERGYDVRAGYCAGYMAAMLEKFKLDRYEAITAADVVESCFELDRVTVGQIRAVFLKWAENNPELWHNLRVWGLEQAITEAWPCEPAKDTDKP